MTYRSKIDQRAYARRHHAANKALYKDRARAHDALKKVRIRDFLDRYLSSHPCVDCGESDPIVLEFDHRVPADKSFAIADALSRGYSLAAVKREVAKCDVRLRKLPSTQNSRTTQIGRDQPVSLCRLLW